MTTEPLDPDRLQALRTHYDTTDTAAELASAIADGTAVWDTATRPGPPPGTGVAQPPQPC